MDHQNTTEATCDSISIDSDFVQLSGAGIEIHEAIRDAQPDYSACVELLLLGQLQNRRAKAAGERVILDGDDGEVWILGKQLCDEFFIKGFCKPGAYDANVETIGLQGFSGQQSLVDTAAISDDDGVAPRTQNGSSTQLERLAAMPVFRGQFT